ncbi:MAG: hypothetical protein BWX98_02420 [Candidatus Aminicenantes bacterium ADurb.Bin147]|nr:MAG: hypothetical protein BWX98_02420 [Candidatus Aminicenantes bacterium ADurb.Bin147]
MDEGVGRIKDGCDVEKVEVSVAVVIAGRHRAVVSRLDGRPADAPRRDPAGIPGRAVDPEVSDEGPDMAVDSVVADEEQGVGVLAARPDVIDPAVQVEIARGDDADPAGDACRLADGEVRPELVEGHDVPGICVIGVPKLGRALGQVEVRSGLESLRDRPGIFDAGLTAGRAALKQENEEEGGRGRGSEAKSFVHVDSPFKRRRHRPRRSPAGSSPGSAIRNGRRR